MATQVLSGLLRLEDWEHLRSANTWALHQKASHLELQAQAYRSALAVRAISNEVWRQQAQELKATQEAERQASAAYQARMAGEQEAILSNLKTLAAQCDQHKADLAQVQGENAALLADKEALTKEVQELRGTLTSVRERRDRDVNNAREKSFEAGKNAGFKEGYARGSQEAELDKLRDGIVQCRSHILMAPPGQKFLDLIVKGLPEAFLHSHPFRQMLQPYLSEMVTSMLFSICDQLGAEERVGEVQIDQVLPEVMKSAPAVDPTHGENYPWYLDVLKSAAEAFRGLRGANAPGVVYPPPGQIDYPVHRGDDAAMRNLQMAFESRAVQLLHREVDRTLHLRGIDPEDLQKTAEVVDAETGEAAAERAAPGVEGPEPEVEEAGRESPGAAVVIEGVGVVHVEHEAVLPPPVHEHVGLDVPEGHVEDIFEEGEVDP